MWTHTQRFSNGTVSKGINVVVEEPKNRDNLWFIRFGPESLTTYNSPLPDVRNIINSLELISPSSPLTNTSQGASIALANNNTNGNQGSSSQGRCKLPVYVLKDFV